MAIGSDSTDGRELIKLPDKLFDTFKKLTSGGQMHHGGGRTADDG
jgi:hypothetical protein